MHILVSSDLVVYFIYIAWIQIEQLSVRSLLCIAAVKADSRDGGGGGGGGGGGSVDRSAKLQRNDAKEIHILRKRHTRQSQAPIHQ